VPLDSRPPALEYLRPGHAAPHRKDVVTGAAVGRTAIPPVVLLGSHAPQAPTLHLGHRQRIRPPGCLAGDTKPSTKVVTCVRARAPVRERAGVRAVHDAAEPCRGKFRRRDRVSPDCRPETGTVDAVRPGYYARVIDRVWERGR
jgi:hypothetical protein